MTTPDVPNVPSPPPKPVLVVDDSPDACRGMARLLGLLGFRAACALSGPEALSQLESELPALVILDVMMPGMGGMEVLGRVRGDPRTAALPVVMFTALTDEATRAEALRLGADDYWVKASLDFAAVKGKIQSLLAAGEPRGPGCPAPTNTPIPPRPPPSVPPG